MSQLGDASSSHHVMSALEAYIDRYEPAVNDSTILWKQTSSELTDLSDIDEPPMHFTPFLL